MMSDHQMGIELCFADLSFPLYNDIYVNSTGSKNLFDIKTTIYDKTHSAQTTAFFDTSAWLCFMHKDFVLSSGLKQLPLPGLHKIWAFNADGTKNKGGLITHYVCLQLRIGEHKSTQSFLVTNLGCQTTIIGYSFAKFDNPILDFSAKTMEFLRCPTNCRYKRPVMAISAKDLDGLNMQHLEDVMEDNYTQLNNDNWGSDTHFIHWVEH
jgi:hypothetical protein